MNWVRPQDRKPVNVPWLLFSAVMVLAACIMCVLNITECTIQSSMHYVPSF